MLKIREVVSVHEAKTHLSRLLARVARGDDVVIARAGRPVARLIPMDAPGPRSLGKDRERVFIAEDFDAPLPEVKVSAAAAPGSQVAVTISYGAARASIAAERGGRFLRR